MNALTRVASPAAYHIHIITPAPASTPRARRRAYARALPAWWLYGLLRSNRREMASVGRYPSSYDPDVSRARLALDTARIRGALLALGRGDLAAVPSGWGDVG